MNDANDDWSIGRCRLRWQPSVLPCASTPGEREAAQGHREQALTDGPVSPDNFPDRMDETPRAARRRSKAFARSARALGDRRRFQTVAPEAEAPRRRASRSSFEPLVNFRCEAGIARPIPRQLVHCSRGEWERVGERRADRDWRGCGDSDLEINPPPPRCARARRRSADRKQPTQASG